MPLFICCCCSFYRRVQVKIGNSTCRASLRRNHEPVMTARATFERRLRVLREIICFSYRVLLKKLALRRTLSSLVSFLRLLLFCASQDTCSNGLFAPCGGTAGCGDKAITTAASRLHPRTISNIPDMHWKDVPLQKYLSLGWATWTQPRCSGQHATVPCRHFP